MSKRMFSKSLLGVGALLSAGLSFAPNANAQLFNLTPTDLIKYTSQNPYERFPDGRPKVPDTILEKVKSLSSEEVLGIVRRGYPGQFVGDLQSVHQGQKLVGRAFTLQLMPLRAEIADTIAAERQSKNLRRLSHQGALDMLQPGDVFVVDAFGNLDAGGIVGDNLAYYIWTATGAGFVIDGAIRDLEGIANIPMQGYFRGAVPPGINSVMVTGINVPVRIGHTTVMPGDVVLGDREGVTFIPPHLVEEIVSTAEITHLHDEWTRMKFDERKYKSTEIYGRPSDPALIKEYEDFLKQRLDANAYEQYTQRQRRRQQNRSRRQR